MMKALRLFLFCGLILPCLPGCQGRMPPRRSLAANEPVLDVPGATPIVADNSAAVGGGATVVDRHPLLSKPRDYYESSGDNKIVKTAAATVIGIPAGIVGEFRQIFTGQPPKSR